MRFGFYTRLALDGIRKNRRIYLPYVLTSGALAAVYYIVAFLRCTDAISGIVGVNTVRFTLELGGWVLAAFSCVFLLYAGAFVMRSRKREFGLYNIFGMDRGGIARVLERETAILAAVSVAGGLVIGIACSKFAELGLLKTVGGESDYSLRLEPRAVCMTVLVFAVIFLLRLIHAEGQIGDATAVSLLHSEHTGESPPKANRALGLAGAALLAAGYLIALTADPGSNRALLTAAFLAVLLVIAGTYVTMTAGSVLMCRILRSSKSYYYRPAHFVSVSSMAFRMRRNGAGLASICILITAVLVMISSTACLLYGARFDFNVDYPRDLTLDFVASDPEKLSGGALSELRTAVLEGLESRGVTPENSYELRLAQVAADTGGWQFYFIPLEDHNAATGSREALSPGEALIYDFGNGFDGDAVSVLGMEWRVAGKVRELAWPGRGAVAVDDSSVVVIIPGFDDAIRAFSALSDAAKRVYVVFDWVFNADMDLPSAAQMQLYDDISRSYDAMAGELGWMGLNCDCRAASDDDVFVMYGGIFFLGIILSAVFVLAAVLIIYYKQMTEGFEDRPRFRIMRKIGMTRREIRKSVNSQMLTVFFLPLLLAAVHLAFAFPLMQKLLLAFRLSNEPLFLRVTATVGAAVAAVYAAVYRITSNTYYKLVKDE